jgi:hypothetical protein
MCEQARARNNPLTAQRFADQAEDATRAATLIRSMLEAHVGSTDEAGELEAGA